MVAAATARSRHGDNRLPNSEPKDPVRPPSRRVLYRGKGVEFDQREKNHCSAAPGPRQQADDESILRTGNPRGHHQACLRMNPRDSISCRFGRCLLPCGRHGTLWPNPAFLQIEFLQLAASVAPLFVFWFLCRQFNHRSARTSGELHHIDIESRPHLPGVPCRPDKKRWPERTEHVILDKFGQHFSRSGRTVSERFRKLELLVAESMAFYPKGEAAFPELLSGERWRPCGAAPSPSSSRRSICEAEFDLSLQLRGRWCRRPASVLAEAYLERRAGVDAHDLRDAMEALRPIAAYSPLCLAVLADKSLTRIG